MGKTGIIGGSALYTIEDLKITEEKKVTTPFGDPSGNFVSGVLSGKDVVFLPRHGEKHTLLPAEVNYRANIYAFKILGVDRIISVSAVGSLKEELRPLDMLLVDQFIDRTNQGRKMTFFGEGIVAHIPFADPVCADLRNAIIDSNRDAGITIHNGGTYINMEGPAFSTRAESMLYRSWGVDVIGMTNIAEARLAREAGICYATIAMITDYDCWFEENESVTVDMIIANLNKNVENAKKMLKNTLALLPASPECDCGDSLRSAVITPLDAVPGEVLERLKPILGKVAG